MPDERQASPPNGKRKIGLALSSGMARGWAHIGVIRALKRLGFEFDVVAGCSVGALAGGCYLADRLDALETWALSLNKRKIVSYLDMRMRSGGLIGGEKLVVEMRNHIGRVDIESFPIPYAAMTTDLVTGHEIWIQKGDLVEAMRASFSLPGIFPPVQMQGRWLADGALVCPLPVAACRALGADMVIAVNLNADIIGKSRRPGATVPTAAGFDLIKLLEETDNQEKISLMSSLTRRVFRREYDGPSIFGVLTSSLNIMQDRITRSRLAGDPPDVHIAPRLGHIGLLEFDRTEEAIHEGEAAVMRKRPELADALQVLSQSHRVVGENEPI
ncbi:MAG: patatin-like phospholipase family protein [Alphaproteobacteria bacterium]|nr:patatin-like phospholipase family protein [Alphaproteobacteria bacterium]